MAKLVWGSAGEKFYETGVDRGVLYIDGVGIAWNGLASVQEKSSGGESTPYYVDGVKYAQSSASEDFEATIQAYSRPDEFAACEGLDSPIPGFIVTKQPHKSFGLTYRTLIGNDVDGIDHGYKIHLVYNAYAGIPEQDSSSVADSVEPSLFSWDITALPVIYTGIRPTAHFIIDSRTSQAYNLEILEAKLYGSVENEPYLPEIMEVIGILLTSDSFTVVDNGDGTWTASGDDAWFEVVDSTQERITSPSIEIIDANSFTIQTTN
jgi:hypothetical protein